MSTARWIAQNEDGTYAVGEGDAEIATCKNREDAMRLKEANAESVAWLVTECHINELQIDSIQRLIDRAKRASMTDIKLRINGQDEWYEADWLKHMTRTTPPQRPWVGLTEEEYKIIRYGSDDSGERYISEIASYVDDCAKAIEAKLREKNT